MKNAKEHIKKYRKIYILLFLLILVLAVFGIASNFNKDDTKNETAAIVDSVDKPSDDKTKADDKDESDKESEVDDKNENAEDVEKETTTSAKIDEESNTTDSKSNSTSSNNSTKTNILPNSTSNIGGSTTSGGNSNPSNSTPSNSNISTNNNSTSTNATHTHSWIEQYTTIYHDATGHNETKWVQDTAAWDEQVVTGSYGVVVCRTCGAEYSSVDSFLDHVDETDGMHGNYSVDTRYTYETVHHEATGHNETVWVQDADAYTEQVLSGYKCLSCGATK